MYRVFLCFLLTFANISFAIEKGEQINKTFKEELKSGKTVIVTIKNKKDLFVEGDFSVLPTARFDAFIKKIAKTVSQIEDEFDRLEVLYFNDKVPEAKFRSSVIARIFVEYGVSIKKVKAAYPLLKLKKSLKNDSLLLLFRNVKSKKIVKTRMNETIKNFGPISKKVKPSVETPLKNNSDIEILEDDIPLL